MILLNKVNKADSSMAWTGANFSITKKDEQLFIEAGVLRVAGNRASIVGNPMTTPNFSKDEKGEYTIPAGNRLIGVDGVVADKIAMIQAESAAKSAQIKDMANNPELAKLFLA